MEHIFIILGISAAIASILTHFIAYNNSLCYSIDEPRVMGFIIFSVSFSTIAIYCLTFSGWITAMVGVAVAGFNHLRCDY